MTAMGQWADQKTLLMMLPKILARNPKERSLQPMMIKSAFFSQAVQPMALGTSSSMRRDREALTFNVWVIVA
jgi:hypothetical protein